MDFRPTERVLKSHADPCSAVLECYFADICRASLD